MKTRADIEADLERMASGDYYAENYHLEWSLCNYTGALSAEERRLLDELLLARLRDDPSIVTLSLLARVKVEGAAPVLARMLDRQAHSGPTARALLLALANYDDDVAFHAAGRFLDSDLSREALGVLQAINPARLGRLMDNGDPASLRFGRLEDAPP